MLMIAFWGKDKSESDKSIIEMIEIKRDTHDSVAKAKKDVAKLNRLLKADGITLQIHIATAGTEKNA